MSDKNPHMSPEDMAKALAEAEARGAAKQKVKSDVQSRARRALYALSP
jgi:hypothetical protein